MPILSQLLGTGPNGEVLTAVLSAELMNRGEIIVLQVKNTSPVAGNLPGPVINELLLNITPKKEKFYMELKSCSKQQWKIYAPEDEKTFQTILYTKETGKGLKPGEKMEVVLKTSKYLEEQTFLEALYSSLDGNSIQLGAGFINVGKKAGCKKVGGNYLYHRVKGKNKTTFFPPKKTTTKCPPLTTKFPPVTTTQVPPVTTTPQPKPCPEPNPQTCCQVVVKGRTQLVGPALYDENDPNLYPITQERTLHVEVKKVLAEKVLICGTVKKEIKYKELKKNFLGKTNMVNGSTHDEMEFHCFIDREDANEGDQFEIVGAHFLSNDMCEPKNFGQHPSNNKFPVAWSFEETAVVKICIRKKL
ncbi:hypothetical protein CIB95_09355 [Lottiidibacillus patelloidae]|uniref:SipL SPOCS domain-containing protein n=1 Tax=Lottiidibacillus patelloidae TaxID=2670334 RepID=A0A263BUG6_9BACI|nr:hypothetical protein [Lottiidibacillus patelloidae]OZM56967.1 hypothetical protein CIB95_09355 [Lottiidibacillus patelloidae]